MKKTKLLLFAFFILLFTNCEKEEVSTTEDNKMTSEMIDKNQLKSELKNKDILNYISSNKFLQNDNLLVSRTNNEIELFEKIVKPNDFITYSLKLNHYSNAEPYFKYLIINQDENGEKIGFVKYIPSTPTYILDVDHFTGDIEIYDIDNELFAKTSFSNGEISTLKSGENLRNCTNISYLVGMPCSHGGNHMPGESCEEGLINDAYYVVRTTVVCISTTKSITPPDEFAGSTGGSSSPYSFLASLNIPALYEGEDFLNNFSYLFYLQVQTFLNNNLAYQNLIHHNNAEATFLKEWLDAAVVDYFRNHGFTNDTQIQVIHILNQYIPFLALQSNQYYFEDFVIQKYRTFQLLLQNSSWITNQSNEVQQNIFNYLLQNHLRQEALDFIEELITLANEEPNQADAIKLVNLTLLIENSDDQLFTEEFAEIALQYFDIQAHIPPDYPLGFLSVNWYLNYKKLRQINPEWSRGKCIWMASKEFIHIGLDAFGMVPLIGEPADLINGVLYTIEGDGLNASLSFASTIPIVGNFTTGTKYGLKIINAASTVGTRVKLVWKVTANGIEFGSRSQLRKVLGLAVGNANQAHHIIPWEFRNWTIVQKAAQSSNAFHMNEALNGIALLTSNHLTGHAVYNTKITQKLSQLTSISNTPEQAYTNLTNFANQIRTLIQNNPNMNLGQIANLIN